MKKYLVVYTLAIEIEAENEDDVLKIAAEHDYNDFAFMDVEFDEIEGE